ncbi:VanZ family protein [Leifsonia sp. McL0607]|uniref:VanZ family protein n=1 Tax=Leifsonia sp. McL0607 TaxID=3415672 RepID=UPI003CED1598
MRHRLLLAVTGLYLLAVAWITLNPFPGDPHRNTFLEGLLTSFAATPALAWIDFDVVEFTANILLFVPMGVLLSVLLGRDRRWLALLLGVAASLTIEFVQLFEPARVSDPRDIVANSLGALIGIGLVLVAGGRRSRPDATPSRSS